jgi:hypothetical protein
LIQRADDPFGGDVCAATFGQGESDREAEVPMPVSEMPKESFRIDLRIVFYQESGFWVAHCLEMDVLGHGPDKETAMENLAIAMGMQFEESLRNNNPANIIQPADQKYFEMYFSGKDVAKAECVINCVQKVAKHSGRIQIDGVTGRVFAKTPVLA